MKRTLASDLSYAEMNEVAAQAPIGAAGISILPFGNGAERMLQNQEIGCSIQGVNFNLHNRSHLLRAAQEGIVFSFRYGIDIMKGMGMDVRKIHAGHANMFLSPLFRDTLAGVTGATIELYDTDGSVGAAKGAGMGAGIYRDNVEAFATLDKLAVIEPRLPTKPHTPTHTHVGKNVSKNQQTIKYNNSLTYKTKILWQQKSTFRVLEKSNLKV